MEATGSIAGLAGLFSTCLDVIERADYHRDIEVEAGSLIAQFEADRFRFRQWGQQVGIETTAPKEHYHNALDDPAVSLAVEKILQSIKEIGGHGDAAHNAAYGQTSAASGDARPYETVQKTRFLALVQSFAAFVQTLHDLVSPGSDGTDQFAAARTMVPDSPGDVSVPFDLKSIAVELEKELESKTLSPACWTWLSDEDETRNKLNSWLGASWTNEAYNNSIQRRTDGTCEWILQRKDFRDWEQEIPGSAKILWVNGPPGYGKTTMCARVIQHLAASSDTPLAHFSFSFELESRADPFVVMRSWISQITAQSPLASDLARAKWEAADAKVASRADIIELLGLVVDSLPSCTFIVDGLDECAEAGHNVEKGHEDPLSHFLQSLKRVVSEKKGRILIFSNDEQKIREALVDEDSPDAAVAQYRISPEDVKSDATAFSRSIIDRRLTNMGDVERRELSQRMVSRCESMFLWIKLQEGQLRAGKSHRQLKQTIDKAPTALDDIYDASWRRISNLPDTDRSRALAILRWTTFAVRPMTVLEMTEALLLEDEECADFTDEDLPESIEEGYIKTELLDLCAPLVEVRGAGAPSSLTVHLTHFSVRQYILCHSLAAGGEWLASELRPMNEADQNTILAKACIRYLNFTHVREEPQAVDSQRRATRAFREYASRFWYRHVQSNISDWGDVPSTIDTLFHPKTENYAAVRENRDSTPQMAHHDGETNPGDPLFGFYAKLLGHLDKVSLLLEDAGMNIDYSDPLHRTAFLAACARGWVAGVEYLLEKGANVGVAGDQGTTPIYASASNGRVEVTRLLIENGADLNVTNIHGQSPLNVASHNGHLEVVELLLDKGADLATIDADGWTPLFSASYNGHLKVVQALLEKDADLSSVTTDGWTSLNVASSHGYPEVVKALLEKGADPTIANAKGWTPLHFASEKNHFEVARALIQSGTDLNATNKKGWTPLNTASDSGYLELVGLFLEKGADLTVADNYGWTPLHSASDGGYLEIARLLLEKGADLNVTNESGWTPLNAASDSGHLEVVKLLIEKGADLTMANTNGWTPLHCASGNGHLEVVKFLIDNDTNLTTGSGSTPLHVASLHGHSEVVKLLLESGTDLLNGTDENGWTPLNAASDSGHQEVVKILLKKGADLNIANKEGWTPLTTASSNGHFKVVELLVASGADVTVATDGWTPLNAASNEGHIEVVKVLVENGASLSATNNHGCTPLYSAASKGHLELAKLLLEKGADQKIANHYGGTPLGTASDNGSLEVVKLLLTHAAVDMGPGKDRTVHGSAGPRARTMSTS